MKNGTTLNHMATMSQRLAAAPDHKYDILSWLQSQPLPAAKVS
jgi:hypothetical protein